MISRGLDFTSESSESGRGRQIQSKGTWKCGVEGEKDRQQSNLDWVPVLVLVLVLTFSSVLLYSNYSGEMDKSCTSH